MKFDSKDWKIGFLHLLIVYVVWGSTYLAIRVAVREGSGFTPFMMGAMRVLVAGAVLLLIGLLSRQRLRINIHEMVTLAGSGILLWTGGNGLVMLAERRADSAMAAIIIACTPIWVAVLEGLIDRKLPSLKIIAFLLLGIIGIVVLSVRTLLTGSGAEIMSIVELMLATVSWAGGSVWQARGRLNLAPAVSSGFQSIFGGVGFVILALLLREPIPSPILEAWFAWGYLVVFGSIVAFTSYVQALRLLPIKLVATYSYVNPIIAVFLGWIILDERISILTLVGALIVLLSVTGVFRTQVKDDATVGVEPAVVTEV